MSATTTLKAIITGSSAGAVRAFEEASLAADKGAKGIGESVEGAASKVGGLFSKLGGMAGSLGLPFSESISTLGEKFGETETKGKSAFQSLSSVGGAALAGIGGAAVAAGFESIKLAENFDTATSKIAASAGISQQAAHKIGEAFLSTAGTSTFTGTEMAQAYAPVAAQLATVQGHALNASQALTVMKASADLAEASGTDLTTSTSGLAAVMQTYSMRAQDASYASDILYNTSRLTNTGVGEIAQAADKLKGRLGILAPDLNQTATLMGLLGEHGITGSRGLMVVNTAMSTLLGGSKGVQSMLKELGLNIFDANGKFVGMRSVIAQLQPELAKMTDAQRTLAEKTLFGSTAGQAMNSVLLSGVSAYDKTALAVGEAGAAHEAAEKATDNLHGQIEKLKAAGEDLATKFGEILIPKIEALARIISSTIQWFEKHKTAALALAAVIGGVLAVAIGAFVVNMGVKFVKSVGSAAKSLDKLVTKTIPKFVQSLGFMRTAEEEQAATAEATGEATSMAFGPIGIAIMAVIAVVTLMVTHWKQTKEILSAIWDGIKMVAITVWDFIKAHLSIIATAIAAVVLGPIGALAVEIATHWNTVKADAVRIWNAILGFLRQAWQVIKTIFEDASIIGLILSHWTQIKTDATNTWNAVVRFISGIPGKILGVFKNAGSLLLGIGGHIIDGLKNGIEHGVGAVINAIKSIGSKIKGVFSSIFSIFSPSRVFHGYGVNLMQGLALGIGESSTLAERALTAASSSLATVPFTLPSLSSAALLGGTTAPPAAGTPGAAPAASAMPAGVGQTVNVYATTNADPHQIAAEVGFALKTA